MKPPHYHIVWQKTLVYEFGSKTTDSSLNLLQKTLIGPFGHFNRDYDKWAPQELIWHNC